MSSGGGTRINDQIRVREVRLIDEAGEQLGIVSTQEALQIARDRELDLVEVAAQASPPVCRVMNFAKWKYDEEQRQKEARKKATNIVIKEMKYRVKIGTGDFDTKTRKVAQFLKEGHKVKITIMFRGREVERPSYGADILNRIAEAVEDIALVEFAPKLDGRNMTMVLAPGKPKRRQAPPMPTGANGGSAEGAGVTADVPDAAPAAAPETEAVAAAPNSEVVGEGE